jgi:hypothetical protein
MLDTETGEASKLCYMCAFIRTPEKSTAMFLNFFHIVSH